MSNEQQQTQAQQPQQAQQMARQGVTDVARKEMLKQLLPPHPDTTVTEVLKLLEVETARAHTNNLAAYRIAISNSLEEALRNPNHQKNAALSLHTQHFERQIGNLRQSAPQNTVLPPQQLLTQRPQPLLQGNQQLQAPQQMPQASSQQPQQMQQFTANFMPKMPAKPQVLQQHGMPQGPQVQQSISLQPQIVYIQPPQQQQQSLTSNAPVGNININNPQLNSQAKFVDLTPDEFPNNQRIPPQQTQQLQAQLQQVPQQLQASQYQTALSAQHPTRQSPAPSQVAPQSAQMRPQNMALPQQAQLLQLQQQQLRHYQQIQLQQQHMQPQQHLTQQQAQNQLGANARYGTQPISIPPNSTQLQASGTTPPMYMQQQQTALPQQPQLQPPQEIPSQAFPPQMSVNAQLALQTQTQSHQLGKLMPQFPPQTQLPLVQTNTPQKVPLIPGQSQQPQRVYAYPYPPSQGVPNMPQFHQQAQFTHQPQTSTQLQQVGVTHVIRNTPLEAPPAATPNTATIGNLSGIFASQTGPSGPHAAVKNSPDFMSTSMADSGPVMVTSTVTTAPPPPTQQALVMMSQNTSLQQAPAPMNFDSPELTSASGPVSRLSELLTSSQDEKQEAQKLESFTQKLEVITQTFTPSYQEYKYGCSKCLQEFEKHFALAKTASTTHDPASMPVD
ncbi:hypothetical protein Pelo_4296 [Pelomyxa schiedti]|nr:hypothetical protein Pelo_4296 [Pelomyxa schiedti]